MTWEKLKSKANKLGYLLCRNNKVEWLSKGLLTFTKEGEVEYGDSFVAEHRTPEQMYAIMEALK